MPCLCNTLPDAATTQQNRSDLGGPTVLFLPEFEAIEHDDGNDVGSVVPFGSAVLAAKERQINFSLTDLNGFRDLEDVASFAA